ncbi:MAG: hypothetical protein RLZZ263_1402, partial [Cyanobacteriota bacterium]
GTGVDLSIRDLATAVASVVGFSGEIGWDNSKPDGTPRKILNVSRMTAIGWQARIPLMQGLVEASRAFVQDWKGGVLRD